MTKRKRFKKKTLPCILPVTHQHGNTCSLICLHMISGESLEQVTEEAKKVTKHWRTGLWGTQIRQLAARLGVTLVPKRKWSWDTAVGILGVDTRESTNGKWLGHTVVLFSGVVYDPWERLMYTPEVYQGLKAVRIRCIYQMEEE